MLDLILSQKDINALKRMTVRQICIQFINAVYAVIGTYMVWKAIGILMNNDAPIVVVLSESMSPGFERGDILFLSPKNYDDYVTGDMTVFQLSKNEIPIVHRAIKRHGGNILTKGDNNKIDDVSLYRRGQRFLTKRDLVSRVVGCLPFCGMVTIWINTIPNLRFIAMAFIGFGVLFTRVECYNKRCITL